MVNFSPLAAEIGPVVWGTPANFNGFRVLAALLHGNSAVGVSQTSRRWTEGATYIWQCGHHAGHRPTFLVYYYVLLSRRLLHGARVPAWGRGRSPQDHPQRRPWLQQEVTDLLKTQDGKLKSEFRWNVTSRATQAHQHVNRMRFVMLEFVGAAQSLPALAVTVLPVDTAYNDTRHKQIADRHSRNCTTCTGVNRSGDKDQCPRIWNGGR